MSKNLISEQQVKDVLQIDSFRNLSKDKVMEFISLIPNMDKEVAISIINQFSAYSDMAKNMIGELRLLCETALKENTGSQKDAIAAYIKILDQLAEMLKKEDITREEREYITNKMLEVADKIATKDSENKEFLMDIVKCGAGLVGMVIVAGATILGVKISKKD